MKLDEAEVLTELGCPEWLIAKATKIERMNTVVVRPDGAAPSAWHLPGQVFDQVYKYTRFEKSPALMLISRSDIEAISNAAAMFRNRDSLGRLVRKTPAVAALWNSAPQRGARIMLHIYHNNTHTLSFYGRTSSLADWSMSYSTAGMASYTIGRIMFP